MWDAVSKNKKKEDETAGTKEWRRYVIPRAEIQIIRNEREDPAVNKLTMERYSLNNYLTIVFSFSFHFIPG